MGPDHELRTDYLRLKAAIYDPNTDLKSMPGVLDAVRGLFVHGRWVGVIHLALHRLPRIEAIYGWQATDRLLRLASVVLHDCVGDVIPRESILAQTGIYGGHFVAFVPVPEGSPPTLEVIDRTASRLAGRMEERFRTNEFNTMSPPVEFRMGYAVISNEPFFRFERLVYRAVEEARTLAGKDDARKRSREQTELRRIISEGDIEVVFQPVVHLDDSRIIGYEAFCRGPRNTDFEKPLALFATSKDASLARELDLLCQRRALARACGLGRGDKLFLNALPDSLLDPGFRDHLLTELPANLLLKEEDIVLEIADRDTIGDYKHFEHEVGELRTRGFRLGVDDVGTGSGSLQTIAEVRPDYIKVDGSLIRNIQANLVKQEMLRSLSSVAHSIDATIVAEGIESGEELVVVRDCGVHYGQGFLFAHPQHDPPASIAEI
jgi:EAL domain-containing protein (putative c-di-GMP-specific phosphodiesterase class I)